MAKNEELEKRIAENMARLGGTHEFWERRLTHGWDSLEAKLQELQAQGMIVGQIVKMDFPEIWAFYIPSANDYARANGSIRTYSSKAAALKYKKNHSNAILIKLTAKWEA